MQAFKNIEMIFKYIEDTTDTILLKDFLIRQDSAAISYCSTDVWK